MLTSVLRLAPMTAVLPIALLQITGCAQVLGLDEGVQRDEGSGGAVGGGGAVGEGGAVGGGGAATSAGGAGGDISAYAEVVLADNPVAFWRLNETAPPDANDSSPSQLDGLYKGSVSLGEPGALAEVDNTAIFMLGGMDTHVEVADTLDFDGEAPMTLEAWVQQTTIDGTIMAKAFYDGSNYQGWLLYMQGFRACIIREVTVCSTEEVGMGEWTHVVGLFDGGVAGTVRIYVNGIEANSATSSGPLADTSELIRIGHSAFGGWDGYLDEIAIYDYALSESRIMAHYMAGVGR